MQPIIQRICDRLLGWKRNFLSCLGRELLIKYVLFSITTYFLTIFKMSKWGFHKIDRFRRGFLWKGREWNNVSGGRCLVNW
jgi:hypothetical protein